MRLKISPDVLLSQLGYSINDATISQATNIIKATKNFDNFSKHILSLNDHLKKINAYVAMSNTKDCLKIKFENLESKKNLEEFHNIVLNWSKKYNVKLEKLDKKEIYYIIGIL